MSTLIKRSSNHAATKSAFSASGDVSEQVKELSAEQPETQGIELTREDDSSNSVEQGVLHVAQVDIEYNLAGSPDTAEVMSDLGEAGLLSDSGSVGWEAKEIVFANPSAGMGVLSYLGTPGGAFVVGTTIAVAGKIAQNSNSHSLSVPVGSGTINAPSFSGDTTVVVFDLVHGVTSNHSGRTFDPDTTYQIYVVIDSNQGWLISTPTGAATGATWGTWQGANNLGADDTINMVGDTGPIDPDWFTQLTAVTRTDTLATQYRLWADTLTTSGPTQYYITEQVYITVGGEVGKGGNRWKGTNSTTGLIWTGGPPQTVDLWTGTVAVAPAYSYQTPVGSYIHTQGLVTPT